MTHLDGAIDCINATAERARRYEAMQLAVDERV